MKPSPANHRASKAHEGLVDIIAPVKSGSQAAELMQQGCGLLDHVTEDAQATAVCFTPAGDDRVDATHPQLHAMTLGVIAAIRQ